MEGISFDFTFTFSVFRVPFPLSFGLKISRIQERRHTSRQHFVHERKVYVTQIKFITEVSYEKMEEVSYLCGGAVADREVFLIFKTPCPLIVIAWRSTTKIRKINEVSEFLSEEEKRRFTKKRSEGLAQWSKEGRKNNGQQLDQLKRQQVDSQPFKIRPQECQSLNRCVCLIQKRRYVSCVRRVVKQVIV